MALYIPIGRAWASYHGKTRPDWVCSSQRLGYDWLHWSPWDGSNDSWVFVEINKSLEVQDTSQWHHSRLRDSPASRQTVFCCCCQGAGYSRRQNSQGFLPKYDALHWCCSSQPFFMKVLFFHKGFFMTISFYCETVEIYIFLNNKKKINWLWKHLRWS